MRRMGLTTMMSSMNVKEREMTIREAVYGTMIPSHKSFMEEEVFSSQGDIKGIDFDDELDKSKEYQLTIKDEYNSTHLVVDMSWENDRLVIDSSYKAIMVDHIARFDEDSDEYWFDEV